MNGLMNDLLIVNQTLTTNEITALQAGISVPVTPPVLVAANCTHPDGVPNFAIPNTVTGHQYTPGYKNNLTDAIWTWLAGSGTAGGTGGTSSRRSASIGLRCNNACRNSIHL